MKNVFIFYPDHGRNQNWWLLSCLVPMKRSLWIATCNLNVTLTFLSTRRNPIHRRSNVRHFEWVRQYVDMNGEISIELTSRKYWIWLNRLVLFNKKFQFPRYMIKWLWIPLYRYHSVIIHWLAHTKCQKTWILFFLYKINSYNCDILK